MKFTNLGNPMSGNDEADSVAAKALPELQPRLPSLSECPSFNGLPSSSPVLLVPTGWFRGRCTRSHTTSGDRPKAVATTYACRRLHGCPLNCDHERLGRKTRAADGERSGDNTVGPRHLERLLSRFSRRQCCSGESINRLRCHISCTAACQGVARVK